MFNAVSAGLFRRILRQRRDVRHDGRVLLVNGPEVPAVPAHVVIHIRAFTCFVQVAWRLPGAARAW